MADKDKGQMDGGTNAGYNDEEDEYITIEYDDGEEVECLVIGVFEANGKEYIALNPVGTDEAHIYGYKELGDDFDMFDIEDEKEFEAAVKAFEELAAEEA